MELRRTIWMFVTVGIGLAPALSSTAVCDAFEDDRLTSHRRIRWEDYRGARPVRAPAGQPAIVAHIATSVRLDSWRAEVAAGPDGTWVARVGDLCVRAYMHKDRSGYVRTYRGRWDLAHEQGHFDIAELCARTLRARFLALRIPVESPEQASDRTLRALRSVYLRTMAECQKEQDRYEHETSSGSRRSRQMRWTHELAARLNGSADEPPGEPGGPAPNGAHAVARR
jgi:hypothetical protein